jgi:beta-lactamase regulating signal transducer with metallopeptidase domain
VEGILDVILGKAVLAAALAAVAAGSGLLGARAGLRHALWLMVLLSFFVPPILRIPIAIDLLARGTGNAGEPLAEPAALPAVPEGEGGARASPALSASAAPPAKVATGGLETPFPRISVREALLGAWVLGSLVVLAVALRRIQRCSRLVAETEPGPETAREAVLALARRWGISRPPRVRFTEHQISPFLWALGRARIVVPRLLWERLDGVQQRTLLAHEVAHHARRDHLIRWLELCVGVVYWWHPAVWIARRELRAAEEELVDGRVVGSLPGSERSYGETLLRTLDLIAGDLGPTAAAGSAIGALSLARRLRLLRDGAVAEPLTRCTRGLLLVLAVPCLALGIRCGTTDLRRAAPPADEDEGSYPHALPAWYEELDAKLSKRVTFLLYEPTPLAKALSDAGSLVDVKVELRDGMAKLADVPVAPLTPAEPLTVVDLPLLNLLNVLMEQAGSGNCRLVLVPGAAVVTDAPGKYPVPKAVPVRRRIEEVRRFHGEDASAKREKEAEWRRQTEARLKSTMVAHFDEELSLADFLNSMEQMLDINLVIVRGLHDDRMGMRVSAGAKEGTVEQVLEKALAPLDLSSVYKEGAVVVMSKTEADKERSRLASEEARRGQLEKQIEKLRETRLPAGFSGRRPREIVGPLQKSLEFPVYPDPAAWAASRPVQLPGQDATMRDLVAALETLGVRGVIESDGMYLFGEQAKPR